MKVFIAGSKNISHLDDAVIKKLRAICHKNYTVLVGDCYGVDSMVQRFLSAPYYTNVRVYASNGRARNNIGAWSVSTVTAPAGLSGFDFYRQKDIAMAQDADCGFMIWDGVSKGTLCDILDLVSQGKTVLTYLTDLTEMVTLRNVDDLLAMISSLPNARSVYAKVSAKYGQTLYQQISMV